MPVIINGTTGISGVDGSAGAPALIGSDADTGLVFAAGQITASLNGSGANVPLVQGTAQNSTSGVSIVFTGIPTWARRITVMFNGVSTNGTNNILVQLGTDGAPTTSGYAGYSVFSWASGVVPTSSTAGIPIFNNAASYNHYGHLVLTNISGNTWVGSGQFATAGTQGSTVSGGAVTLAGLLNYLRIVASNGIDAFDAGAINILYE